MMQATDFGNCDNLAVSVRPGIVSLLSTVAVAPIFPFLPCTSYATIGGSFQWPQIAFNLMLFEVVQGNPRGL